MFIDEIREFLPASVKDVTHTEKINNALDQTDWDAFVLLGPENVQFFSRAWLQMARGYLDRQNIVVWPKTGDPTYITGTDWIMSVEPQTSLKIVGYEEKGALPPAVIVDTLADVLRKDGLAEAKIGLEMLRTPVPFFNRLQELLPRATFEAADHVFRRLRMVKSMEEIEHMVKLTAATDDANWKAFHDFRAGITEREASKIIMSYMREKDDIDYVSVVFVGTGEGARTFGVPTDRKMEPGDIVRMDMNSITAGYYCDMGRMGVVGKPSDDQVKAYRDQVEFKRHVFDFMKPGVTCSEVYAFYCQYAEENNLKLWSYPFIGLGHGIGLNNTEYPLLISGDDTVLEQGMIINVEPDTIGPKDACLHTEDMVLVTTQGVVRITESGHDWWSELFVFPI